MPMMQEEQVHVPKIVTQTRRWPGFKRCQVGFRGPFLQFRSLGGARLYTPIMENHMEKNMENDMDTGTIWGPTSGVIDLLSLELASLLADVLSHRPLHK